MKTYFGGNYGGSISPVLFRGKPSVDTYNDLPVTGNEENDLRSVKDTDHLYVWTIASPTGDLSDWMDIGSTVGNLDTISDGATYGRVLLSELESGQVKRLDDGSNEVEAVDAKDAVDKKHTHSNKTQLDLITDGDHDVRTDNPHSVTKSQVGLTNVPDLDTTDAVNNEHVQGTDLGLDTGGSNPVTAATIKIVTDNIEFVPGSNNISIGGSTLGGSSNLLLGYGIGGTITGTNNVCIGKLSGDSLTSGSNNTLVGSVSGRFITTGIQNTLVGYFAGRDVGTEDRNTYVGFQTGQQNIGSNNVLIGAGVGQTNRTWSNKLAIDVTDRADALILGDFSARTLQINGDLESTGDFTMKVYSQDAEPTLDTDNKMCMWIDTNDSNRTHLLFRRGSGDQVGVELA